MQHRYRLFIPTLLSATLLVGCDKGSNPSPRGALAPAALVPTGGSNRPVEKLTTPQSPSGTRLRSIFFQGEDGSREHFGFFDKERDEECRFELVSGGKGKPFEYRCFPAFSGARYCDDAVPYYQDSSCSVPLYTVWRRSSENPNDKYYRVNESRSGEPCPEKSVVPGIYKIKRWVQPTSLYQKRDYDQACVEFTLGFENYRFFEFGEKIPNDVFARAVLTTDLP